VEAKGPEDKDATEHDADDTRQADREQEHGVGSESASRCGTRWEHFGLGGRRVVGHAAGVSPGLQAGY